MANDRSDIERLKETVERLSGDRGAKDKSQTAIRRGELRALASVKMKSTQVSAAPTQAEFNNLQSDVVMIYETLARISNLLGTATIPKV